MKQLGIFKNPFRLYRGLPTPVYALFLAQIVNALGNLVFPFLTLYLTQKLGWSSGRSGMLILAAALAYVPGSLIGGRLVDTIGRKTVLILTQGLAAAALIPCAFLGISPLVPGFIIAAHFFFGGADPAHESITADITPPDQRQAAFSLLYLGHNIGFSAGPMIAGFLFSRSLPLLFLGDAATTFAALLVVFLLVPESKPDAETMAAHGTAPSEKGLDLSDEQAETGGLLPVLLKRPYLIAFTLISLVLTFVYSQFTFSLPLLMEEVYPSRGPFFYGTLMTVNALTVIFLTAPLIALTRPLRPIFSTALGAVFFAAGFGMLAFVTPLGLFVLSTLLWTLGEILQATNTNVYIANHTPISHRGRFNSLLPLLTGAGFALGPPIMGRYIDLAGTVRAVWPLTGLLALLCAAALVLLGLLEDRSVRRKTFRPSP